MIPTSGRCVRRLVDAHFSRRITPEKERKLRLHLPVCASCRGYYERWLLVAAVDPSIPGRLDRLALGLGLPAHRPVGRPSRTWLLAAASATAAVVGLAVALKALSPGGPPAQTDFRARGGAADADTALLVYRIRAGAASALVDRAIAADEELAFAYRNPSGWARLLVFAVNDRGDVYWYHPAWNDAREDPQAVPIETSSELVELGEAVKHPLRGQRIHLYGVFTDQPLTVREVEARIASLPAARLGRELSLGRTHQVRLALTLGEPR